jgi:hypothetical protein
VQWLPKYRHYRPKNLAVVRLDGHGIYLGKYDSPENHEKYKRVVGEWLASIKARARTAAGEKPAGPPVNERAVDSIERDHVEGGRPAPCPRRATGVSASRSTPAQPVRPPSPDVFAASAFLNETVVSIKDAAELLSRGRPVPVHRDAGVRWITRGIGGVRLVGYKIGGRWATSREALARFLVELTEKQATPREKEPTVAEYEEAEERYPQAVEAKLKALGL